MRLPIHNELDSDKEDDLGTKNKYSDANMDPLEAAKNIFEEPHLFTFFCAKFKNA